MDTLNIETFIGNDENDTDIALNLSSSEDDVSDDEDKDIIENQLSDLREFREVIIGDKKNPSEKAANKILEYLKD